MFSKSLNRFIIKAWKRDFSKSVISDPETRRHIEKSLKENFSNFPKKLLTQLKSEIYSGGR